jgi:serine phosphatase RsbU (regulator of sigma subunit)
VSDRDEDTTLLVKSIIPAAEGSNALRAHYLLIVDGEGKGRRIPIGNEPFVIGRSSPADVVLADQQISRSHCRVCLAMNEVIVIDLNSSNGSYIDGKKLSGGAPLPVGARLQVGSHILEHEWRIRREVEESQELDRDLDQAWHYIQALLPPPLTSGPIQAEWVLVPCARLGGDAFGYRFLDDRHFAMYLMDVSGHGTGPAMHAVSVINVLRQTMLPEADYREPAKVLGSLNNMFRMETHGNLYFTVWYGVYDVQTRTLVYSSAGHNPSYVVAAGRESMMPLRTRNPAIGVQENIVFATDSAVIAPGSMLYIFSDGVYEIRTKDGREWDIDEFTEILRKPRGETGKEPQRLLEAVRTTAGATMLEDDFSLMAFTFPLGQRTPEETWPNKN